MRQEYQSAKDVSQKELREVVASTEALLAAVGDEGGEAVQELRGRLKTTIADVKKELGSSFVANARETITKARDTASSVDDFVHESPWAAVGIGAGIGLLVGMILRD
ncbi:MAG: YqjD family protein [Steroidobacteraceae bacterium]